MFTGLINQAGRVQWVSSLPETIGDFQQFQQRSTPEHKPAL